MGRYVVRRLLAFIPTLLVVSVLVFLMIDLVPGDPVALMLGLEASGEAINARRLELGLHRPLIERMVSWFAKAAQGNLGDSYFLHQSVTQALAERIPITFSLASLALTVAIMAGMSAGIFASVKQGTMADWGVMLLALFGLSVLGSLLFLGGWEWPFGRDLGLAWQLILMGSKTMLMLLTIMWIGATFPRLRIDQLMAFCWKILLPFAFLQVMVNGIVLVYDLPDVVLLMTSGGLLVALAYVVYLVTKQPPREERLAGIVAARSGAQ